MRMRAIALLASVTAVVAVLGVGRPGGPHAATASLRLDGVAFRPELALTSAQHQRGLMFRKRAPVDGMLFVFPRATSGGFWMQNTLVPLKIVFFDSAGKRVRTLRMTPCTKAPCRIYNPRVQYRFALELPAGDERPALRLGPLSQLKRLVARSG
jgi:uncharacterized membrane protein (UPF0127 family)